MGVVDIQTLLPISRNGAIRLTTQNVYLPDDRVLDDAGVTPDAILADHEIAATQDPWLDDALSYLTNLDGSKNKGAAD